jgi:hypothetical protein
MSDAGMAHTLEILRGRGKDDEPKARTRSRSRSRSQSRPRSLSYKRTPRRTVSQEVKDVSQREIEEVFYNARNNVSHGRGVSKLKVGTAVALVVILCALFAIFSVLWNLPKETQQSISEQIPLLFNISSINHHGTRTQPITHLNLFRFLKKSQKKSRKVSKKSAKKSPKKH